MLNFERPKHYAFKPTITVQLVPTEPAALSDQEALSKLDELLEKYSDPMFSNEPCFSSSASNISNSPVTMVSTPVYL